MITAATEKDGAEILEISDQVGVFEPEEVEVVDELWNEYLQRGPEASGYYFLVSREDDHVLGFACYGPRSMTEGTYDLYWIAVNKKLHNKGVGKNLIHSVEDEVRGMGGRLIVVETSGLDIYAPTRKFYLATGYTQEAVLRDFDKPGDDLVIFTKHLS